MSDFSFTPPPSGEPPVVVSTEGTYTLNTAHAEEAKSHLIEYFKNGPRNQAMLDAIGAQLQEVEDAFWELLYAFDIDTATDDQLVILGKIVGEAEGGRSTEDFRSAIRSRILINQSDGKPEQLIEIAELLFPTADVWLQDTPPAAAALQFTGDLGDLTLENLSRLLKQAKAAGVRLDVIHADTVDAAFVWSTDSAPAASSTGWGSDADATVGGVWSSVL